MFHVYPDAHMPPVPPYSCHQRESTPLQLQQQGVNDIRVISLDGRRIAFPNYLAKISPVMALFMEKEGEDIQKGRFIVPLDSYTLTLLKMCIQKLPEVAYDNGNRVPISEITHQTVFVHRDLQPKISSLLGSLSNAELGDLFIAADFLEVTPILRSCLDEVARRIIPSVRYQMNAGLVRRISQELPLSENEHSQMRDALFTLWGTPEKFESIKERIQSFHIPKHHFDFLRMYVYLRFIGTPSFTVEEFIARFGQPNIDPNLTIISNDELGGKGLTSLYGIHLLQDTQIQVLGLSRNKILGSDLDPLFPEHPFARFPKLIHLRLDDNQLGTLPAGTFRGMENLRTLNLNDNLITSLPTGVFQGMGSLTVLNLCHNELSTLPEGLFQDLGSLIHLFLYDNNITTLPEPLFHGLVNLHILQLNNNQIAAVPENLLHGLVNLNVIDLSNNRLTVLPETFFQGLANLDNISLINNRLTELHERLFRGLVNLHCLQLNNNQLTELPEPLFHGLVNLTHLFLYDNQIATLPDHLFQGLTNLNSLSLSNNRISALPDSLFEGLVNLSCLCLDRNQIATFSNVVFRGLIFQD